MFQNCPFYIAFNPRLFIKKSSETDSSKTFSLEMPPSQLIALRYHVLRSYRQIIKSFKFIINTAINLIFPTFLRCLSEIDQIYRDSTMKFGNISFAIKIIVILELLNHVPISRSYCAYRTTTPFFAAHFIDSSGNNKDAINDVCIIKFQILNQ